MKPYTMQKNMDVIRLCFLLKNKNKITCKIRSGIRGTLDVIWFPFLKVIPELKERPHNTESQPGFRHEKRLKIR